jgi:hypothetical protein
VNEKSVCNIVTAVLWCHVNLDGDSEDKEEIE